MTMGAYKSRLPAWASKSSLTENLRYMNPQTQLGKLIARVCTILPDRDLALELLEVLTGTVLYEPSLSVVAYRGYRGLYTNSDPRFLNSENWDRIEDHGRVSNRMVTTIGVNTLVDIWQGVGSLVSFDYHAIGTTNTAENIADTGCIAEISAPSYTTGNRATGALSEGASANIIRSSGTNQVSTGLTLVEHCLMNSPTRGLGVGWDRSVWGGSTISASDALLTRYDGLFSPGG